MVRLLRPMGLAPLIVALIASASSAAEIRMEGTGEVGGGIFLPSGSDEDIARTSPALQLTAAVGFTPHLGVEAEFLYIPILLESQVLQAASHRRFSQMSAVAGLRLTSEGPLSGTQPAVGYASLRAGFARLAAQTGVGAPAGSWTGRSADQLENPAFEATGRTVQRGFVLSPKAGVQLRVSHRAAVDLAFYPLFIFDRNDVSTQFLFTVSLALSAWQSF